MSLGGFQQKCLYFVQEKLCVGYHSASEACSYAAVAVHVVQSYFRCLSLESSCHL